MRHSHCQISLRSLFVAIMALPAIGQTTHTVPGQFSTIQAGIQAASSGDTVLVSPGTYSESLDYLGKNIVVTSVAGALATTLDAGGLATAVSFVSGEGPGAELEGFTITGGVGLGGGPGAVACNGSSPTIRNCRFIGNEGREGRAGAIESSASAAPSISNCRFEANRGGDGGGAFDHGGAGAIQCRYASVLVTDCHFESNAGGLPVVATSDVCGGPGAMRGDHDETTMTVLRCTFEGNVGGSTGAATQSTAGAGAISANLSATLIVEHSDFDSNRGGPAGANGSRGGAGAVLSATGSSVVLDHCSLTDNIGGDGLPGAPGYGGEGAITSYWPCDPPSCELPGLRISDCQITGNVGGYGWSGPGAGAIALWSSASMLAERSTLSGNTGGLSDRVNGVDGGPGVLRCTSSSSPRLIDCLIEDNQGGASTSDGGAGVVLAGSSATALFRRCTLRNNRGSAGTAGFDGDRAASGVLHAGSNARARFESCLVEGNRGGHAVTGKAGNGAFRVTSSGSLALINSIVVRNVGGDSDGRAGDGGAYLGGSEDSFVTNCTFAENVGGISTDVNDIKQGTGGIRLDAGAIYNTIVWDNSSARPQPDVLVPDGFMGVEYSCVGNDVEGAGNFSMDPQFVDPAAGDYRLACSSPCIDTGTRNAEELPAFDFEGDPRPFGAAVDVGADESMHGPIGTSNCIAGINSNGTGAHVSATGTASLTDGCVLLRADGVTGVGLFFYGTNRIQVPFGDGYRCVGGQVYRLPPVQPDNARLLMSIDPLALVAPITPGSTWHFQAWYRDTNSTSSAFNLSDSVSIPFAP